MQCSKCEGRGWIRNPKWHGGGSASEGIKPSFKCKKCGGSGYIIGNVEDVLKTLKHLEQYFTLENKHKEHAQSIRDCINIIEKQ